MRRNCLGRLAAALLGAAAVSLACAQPQGPTTEAQARYYVYGAFLTHAVPEIMGERVALGAELEQRLGVAPGADRNSIYGALMNYTDKRPLSVRKATVEEIARYKPQAKRELKDPLFTVQAGDVLLLVEYDLQQNTIPFVGQIGVAYQPPPPVTAPRAAPTPPVATPRAAPTPPVATIAPRPQEVLKPNGPCVVQPVMSEQDLANCRGVPAARIQPLPPSVVKPPPPPPVARVAPPPAPTPQRVAPCEVKPVMTEEDLANCRAAPGGAARIQPGPPVVVKPQARPAPAPQMTRPAPCEVKAVMTEEDLANCRSAPLTRVDPGPPVVVKPQARVEAAPQRAVACEVKPVMTEEELAACRNAPGGAARVDPGAPPASRPAAAAPQPATKPAATPCVVKPVMSEEDLIACGIRR